MAQVVKIVVELKKLAKEVSCANNFFAWGSFSCASCSDRLKDDHVRVAMESDKDFKEVCFAVVHRALWPAICGKTNLCA